MFHAPQRAKRLYFDAIPRATDEYLANAARAHREPPEARQANPAWHIHAGEIPAEAESPIPFTMLLNLASVVNAENAGMLWGFIGRYLPGATAQTHPLLARLVEHAVSYYRDFVRPTKQFRPPSALEREALADLAETLRGIDVALPVEDLQTVIYDVGKRHPFAALKDWFTCLYQVLLGQQEGPRFGGFVALYGVGETIALIEGALLEAAL